VPHPTVDASRFHPQLPDQEWPYISRFGELSETDQAACCWTIKPDLAIITNPLAKMISLNGPLRADAIVHTDRAQKERDFWVSASGARCHAFALRMPTYVTS